LETKGIIIGYLLIAFAVLICPFAQALSAVSAKVVNAKTGKPISGAYVFFVGYLQ
jgi:hypothetical protein